MTDTILSTRLCSIEDCDEKHYGRGYCKRHYYNFSQRGDPHADGRPQQGNVYDFVAEMKGRISYRVVDYWIRTGAATVNCTGHGSGSRRVATDAQLAALRMMVDEHEAIEKRQRELVDGTFFANALKIMEGHHADASS